MTSTDVSGLSHARWVTHIALAAARGAPGSRTPTSLPPPEVLGTLCDRQRKGIDVRLLLPGPHQDHPTVTFIQRRLYRQLE